MKQRLLNILRKVIHKKDKQQTSTQTEVSLIQPVHFSDLKDYLAPYADIRVNRLEEGEKECYYLFCDGMSNIRQIQQEVLPYVTKFLEHHADSAAFIERGLLGAKPIRDQHQFFNILFAGELAIYFSDSKKWCRIDVAERPQRQPEESNTEISVKGPRDGFIEDLSTNVALIRKRLRSPDLMHEQFIIGEQSQTKVSLLYFRNLTRKEVIDEARRRIKHIEIDALLSSGQLEEIISDQSLSLFPLLDYIGRPDFAAQSLLRGRFIVFVDGSPMAIIAPTNMTVLLKSPEDLHHPFYYVAFERIIRLIGIFIAIFIPGFWVGLSAFNIDQLPMPLLATVSNSRVGIPLSAPMEAFLMLGLFELFREAGVRLPKAVGQTVAVVGGIIVGDAAIRAGLTSPMMLVTAAVTAVATFTLVNQSLSGTVSILRLYILIFSSVLGLYGFVLGLVSIVIYLSRLNSFGLPYLAPISPIYFRDIIEAVLVKPWSFIHRKKSSLLKIQEKQEESNHDRF